MCVVASAVSMVAGGVAANADNANAVVTPVRSGDVVVVDADSRQRELDRGGSATEFTVEPPSGATCPGDSMHDSWRVQTFIVPAAVDPGTIPYGADWPRLDEHMYSLYNIQPVIDVLTVPNESAGSPGLIDALAPLSFAVFPVGELVPGNYRIGIACTLLYQTADYWDTEIVISADADDSPGQMTWRLVNAPVTAPASPDGGSIVPWLVLAGAVIAVALFLLNRRSSPTTSRSKELQ
jgi:hypothetical protein